MTLPLAATVRSLTLARLEPTTEAWPVCAGAPEMEAPARRFRLPPAVTVAALLVTRSSLRREEDEPSRPLELEPRISCLKTSCTAVTERLRPAARVASPPAATPEPATVRSFPAVICRLPPTTTLEPWWVVMSSSR